MMTNACTVLIALMTAAPEHQDANPIYGQLLQTGVALSDDVQIPLPAPLMADGLAADAQQQIYTDAAGGNARLNQFLKPSVVARHVLRMDELTDPDAPGRRADVYFVTYGNLELFESQEFLESLLSSGQEDDEIGTDNHEMTVAELADRGIDFKPENERFEAYVHGSYALIKLIRVDATLHSYWTRTPDSFLVAAVIDPRFADDPEYPNTWRPIERTNTGQQQLGAPQHYGGVGFYVKITQLTEPAGALFVESHLVFSEPYDWFDGANLLGSKLPALIQNRVRATRREIMRSSD